MRSLVLLLVLLACAVPARAQSLEAKLDEARLASRVKIALVEEPTIRMFSFEAWANGDVVTVRGTVETDAQRQRVLDVARSVEGVERVANAVRLEREPRDTAPEMPRVEAEPEPEGAEPEEEPEPEEVYHTVRSGDTLIAIGRRYGVSARQIRELNNLRGSRIRIGQRLRVK